MRQRTDGGSLAGQEELWAVSPGLQTQNQGASDPKHVPSPTCSTFWLSHQLYGSTTSAPRVSKIKGQEQKGSFSS